MLRTVFGLALILSICPIVSANDESVREKIEAEAARRMATLTKHFRLDEVQQEWLRNEINNRLELAIAHDMS